MQRLVQISILWIRFGYEAVGAAPLADVALHAAPTEQLEVKYLSQGRFDCSCSGRFEKHNPQKQLV